MNTIHHDAHAQSEPTVDLAQLSGNALKVISRTMSLWRARDQQRRQLCTLTAAQLDDIGVSAQQAQAEANKPFWRA